MKTGTIARFTAAAVMVASFLLLPATCSAEAGVDAVAKAYELKLNGKADEAKTILEQALAADSTNAAAWFELARVKQQIGLSNPLKLLREMAELQEVAGNAAALDPKNVVYAYYNAYVCFLRAYGSQMRNQPDVPERIAETIAAYGAVLALDPNYHEARLFLIEILLAPAEMTGDVDEAVTHVEELESRDPFRGSMARDLILPDEDDRIEYWSTKLTKDVGNADLLEQLGKAYLAEFKTEEGVEQLEAAMRADPQRQLLLIDIARYGLLASRQDPSQGATVLPMAKEMINRYMETDPIRPLKAFALHTLGRVERALGSEEAADRYNAESLQEDRYVSRAFAIPPGILFTKPNEVTHYHQYFSRPY